MLQVGPAGRLVDVDYFYDTEFMEDGDTIELLSIGVVARDGREFYAVSTDADTSHANDWVRAHVLPHLPNPSSPVWMSRQTIRERLMEFFGDDTHIRLWAWVGAYDHICLAQLFGAMPDLPHRIPRYTRELKHVWTMLGQPALPTPPANAHDALADARHNLAKFEVCAQAWKELTGRTLR